MQFVKYNLLKTDMLLLLSKQVATDTVPHPQVGDEVSDPASRPRAPAKGVLRVRRRTTTCPKLTDNLDQ
jgi:hypothetical protein